MSENTAELSNFTISADDWDTGGLNKPGGVGFKIDAARLETVETKNGPTPTAIFETTILQRASGPVTGEKFFDRIMLTQIGLGQFKNLAAACGVRPAPGAPVKVAEVVKALNGKSAFGRIVHREYVKDGEPQKSANFGKKFGKSMAEVS